MKLVTLTLAAVLAAGCAGRTPDMTTHSVPVTSAAADSMFDAAAERYVKLVLATGEHDSDYVDAYYGPPEWRDDVKSAPKTLAAIRGEATTLAATLAAVSPSDDMIRLRKAYLAHQVKALLARADMLSGKRLSFDEESKALYDAVAPRHDEAYFKQALADLDRELPPGPGSTSERLDEFRRKFVIPPDRIDAVFKKAIEATRERTRARIPLPAEESFTVEYVTDKAWSGYNWYQGGYRSLIQVNTDLPIYIDRAIDLAAHEGYPGHHVYNVLLEKNLVKDRGWVEFTVYPLFSPQSLIAEGSANYGVEVVFPKEDRVKWEKENLFPLAGLDASGADSYYRVHALTDKLGYAGNEAARRYLDGEITAAEAADWLVKYSLMTPERAEQRVRFIDKYRSYVINYNLGKDLVEAHVEALGGTAMNPAARWTIFEALLSSPTLPSGLKTK